MPLTPAIRSGRKGLVKSKSRPRKQSSTVQAFFTEPSRQVS